LYCDAKCNCGERCSTTIVAPAAEGTALTVDLSPNTITTTYNGTKIYTLNGVVLASSIAFTAAGTYVELETTMVVKIL
jgi:hypothetical protein